jgi:hypothetical protein
MSVEIIISIFGALAAAFKWIYEYSEKLKWDRNKFLLDELEKFHNLETTQNAEIILDWNGINITFNNEKIFVNDEILFQALQTHDEKNKFTVEEVKIRALFDDYFDNLTKLVFMCKSKILPEKNFRMFMKYWFNILSGRRKNKPKKVQEQINRYLDFYGYEDLKNFIIYEKRNNFKLTKNRVAK